MADQVDQVKAFCERFVATGVTYEDLMATPADMLPTAAGLAPA